MPHDRREILTALSSTKQRDLLQGMLISIPFLSLEMTFDILDIHTVKGIMDLFPLQFWGKYGIKDIYRKPFKKEQRP